MSSAPVQPHQRIQYLDVIRGFAITGVLIAYVFWNLGTEPSSSFTAFDNVINAILNFLIDSKCFTLLANLFAVGFVLHMSKSEDQGKSVYIYRKRLLGLLILGLLHAVLLRNGDILAPYAILTFLVSFFYRSSNRMITVLIIITFLVQMSLPEIWKALHLQIPQRPQGTGNYWAENFEWVKYWYVSSIFYWEPTLYFLFSGLLLGRIFIKNKKRLTNTQLITISVAGFLTGGGSYLVLNFYTQAIQNLPDIGNTALLRRSIFSLIWLLHQAGLASAYASLFYLLMKRFSMTMLAILGRTSLTNYILQAVIVVPVCLLFNLFDHLTPTISLIMTVPIWIFQVLFSRWWLRQYRFGPLEWVLRRFTYGKSIEGKSIKNPALLVSETNLQ